MADQEPRVDEAVAAAAISDVKDNTEGTKAKIESRAQSPHDSFLNVPNVLTALMAGVGAAATGGMSLLGAAGVTGAVGAGAAIDTAKSNRALDIAHQKATNSALNKADLEEQQTFNDMNLAAFKATLKKETNTTSAKYAEQIRIQLEQLALAGDEDAFEAGKREAIKTWPMAAAFTFQGMREAWRTKDIGRNMATYRDMYNDLNAQGKGDAARQMFSQMYMPMATLERRNLLTGYGSDILLDRVYGNSNIPHAKAEMLMYNLEMLQITDPEQYKAAVDELRTMPTPTDEWQAKLRLRSEQSLESLSDISGMDPAATGLLRVVLGYLESPTNQFFPDPAAQAMVQGLMPIIQFYATEGAKRVANDTTPPGTPPPGGDDTSQLQLVEIDVSKADETMQQEFQEITAAIKEVMAGNKSLTTWLGAGGAQQDMAFNLVLGQVRGKLPGSKMLQMQSMLNMFYTVMMKEGGADGTSQPDSSGSSKPATGGKSGSSGNSGGN